MGQLQQRPVKGCTSWTQPGFSSGIFTMMLLSGRQGILSLCYTLGNQVQSLCYLGRCGGPQAAGPAPLGLKSTLFRTCHCCTWESGVSSRMRWNTRIHTLYGPLNVLL